MYDVIYEAEIALCNINKQPLQLKSLQILSHLRIFVVPLFSKTKNDEYGAIL